MINKHLISVGVIGCGWLGTALAKNLVNEHYQVVVTTQSSEKLAALNTLGVKAEQLILPVDKSQSSLLADLTVFKQDCLIIAIPPQLKKGRVDYPTKISQIVEQAELNCVKRIILISTTAVYNGLQGNVDEKSPLNYAAEKVSIINEAEQKVMAYQGEGVVLRLAGLIGPARHPGNFLKRNSNIANSTAPVNLIHQYDVIGLLQSLIKQPAVNGIFNGVSNTHITKNEFYIAAAKSLSLPLPNLLDTKNTRDDKVVLGNKATRELDYLFKYNDLIAWLSITKPDIDS